MLGLAFITALIVCLVFFHCFSCFLQQFCFLLSCVSLKSLLISVESSYFFIFSYYSHAGVNELLNVLRGKKYDYKVMDDESIVLFPPARVCIQLRGLFCKIQGRFRIYYFSFILLPPTDCVAGCTLSVKRERKESRILED